MPVLDDGNDGLALVAKSPLDAGDRYNLVGLFVQINIHDRHISPVSDSQLRAALRAVDELADEMRQVRQSVVHPTRIAECFDFR